MLPPRVFDLTRSRLFMQAPTLSVPSGTRTTTTASAKPRLPRLPVPDLHQTLQRYLTSLEPFILEDEAKGIVQRGHAIALRKQWAEDFERGLGSTLQERLKGQLAANSYLSSHITLTFKST